MSRIKKVNYMSVRTTSKLAYSGVQASGNTAAQRDQILDYLYTEETAKSLREIQGFTGIDINAVSGRCNELKKDNKLFEYPRRKCTITGRLVVPLSPYPNIDAGGQGNLFSKKQTDREYKGPHSY